MDAGFPYAVRARQIRGRFDQILAFASNGNLTQSISMAPVLSANHRALDHFQARGFSTNPLRTGFMCM